MRYREVDLSRVTTIPVAGRHNKVDQRLLASPPGSDHSFAAFLNSLPDVLAARDLRLVVQAVAAAKRDGRAVILLLGGHVVKVGLGPLIATSRSNALGEFKASFLRPGRYTVVPEDLERDVVGPTRTFVVKAGETVEAGQFSF